MASNAKKVKAKTGQKKTVVEAVKKVRPKKEFILIELTKDVEILNDKANGFPIVKFVYRYGKTYLKCKNERCN